MVKVSVVVPVYNPGAHLADLVRSLRGQSLAADEYEAIFVDDGSTDGTGARLDALAAEHPRFRVAHIPNSGWPGRPRNLGTDMARGTYIFYADNDDWLGPEALERLYERAQADGADVVVGKVVGHGKNVSRELFEADRRGVAVGWDPLLNLLSPHKLFRRAFLAEHRIRFPEGRRRLEDHVFVMQAYFAAQDRISVLADYPCYHWVVREAPAPAPGAARSKKNASHRRIVPQSYFGNVREVLDIVEANTEPGELRDRLRLHWYRSKGLSRLGENPPVRPFVRRGKAYNRELFDAVAALAAERIPPDLDRLLPFNMRVRSHLVRAGDLDGLYALARYEAGLEARVRLTGHRDHRLGADLELQARLRGPKRRLRFQVDGERLLWSPPPSLHPHLTGFDLDATAGAIGALPQVLAVSVTDGTEHTLQLEGTVDLRPAGDGLVSPRLVATAAFRPAELAAGSPLAPGDWELHVVVSIAGFSGTATKIRQNGERTRLAFTV